MDPSSPAAAPAAPSVGSASAPRSPRLPAAASTLAPAWLHGDPAPATVVGTFDGAAYLLRDDEVLPLLAPGALLLPGGLRLASPEDLRALRLRVGDEVEVGSGTVRTHGGALAVRRTWRPRRVPQAPLPLSRRGAALAALLATPHLTDDLPAPLLDTLHAAEDGALPDVAAHVGLGPGLTPAGDDLLCGLLLGLRATAGEAHGIPEEVGAAAHRTTALSATLLRQAALGYAVPPVVELLSSWHGAPADLTLPTRRVAAVGHTSGRALLLGLTVALLIDPTPSEGPS